MPTTSPVSSRGCSLINSLLISINFHSPGRRLDDNAHVMLRFKGGARSFCQPSLPRKKPNGLKLRTDGEQGWPGMAARGT